MHAYGRSDLRVTYIIQNTGKTPAYDVKKTMHFERLFEDSAVIPNTINFEITAEYIIAPGEYEYIKLFKQEHFPERESTKEDKTRLFFTGRFEYVDIFDQPHWLTFAYEYIFRPKEGGMFRQYPKGNDTDKN